MIRHNVVLQTAALAVSAAVFGCTPAAVPNGATAHSTAIQPGICMRDSVASGNRVAFDVVGLPASLVKLLNAAQPTDAEWREFFVVFPQAEPAGDIADRPPMLGSYRITGDVISFEPQFPLLPGLKYRVEFDIEKVSFDVRARWLDASGASANDLFGPRLESTLALPRSAAAAATVITSIFPTRGQLPENQLKFYIHFSAPMGRGDSYKHVRLLDEYGREVELPFLELDEELWDPTGRRFTLFFDPGRIKRGLKPREEFGPVLEEGKRYTLVIDRRWRDARSEPLAESVRKTIEVLAPDDEQPIVSNWKLTEPAAGTSDPLVVNFPDPLDHAMLQRVLGVIDSRGQPVRGEVAVDNEETRWRFTPAGAWQAGDYELVVDTTLEDLAGNSIERPFEVDVLRPIRREIESSTVTLRFSVAEAAK